MKETDHIYNQTDRYPEKMTAERFLNETKPWEKQESDTLVATESPLQLIIWNDHFNTFEWVIAALVEICGHTEEQAEQCAFIIHTKGKYAVKKGDYDTLKPMKDSISDRGIGATIEAVV